MQKIGRDLTGYADRLPPSPFPAGTSAVVSIAVHVAEGAELAVSDGDMSGEQHSEGMLVEAGHQEFAIEYFFEYGTRAGIWRLLRIFDEFGVKATFFCAGRALERNPAFAPRLIDLGHEIACAGWRHIPYYDIAEDAQRREIARSFDAVVKACGVAPVGWCSRVPNLDTRRLLIEHGGFTYDSDGYGDDLPYWESVGPNKLLVVPNTFENSDEKFWPAPNNSGFTNPEHLYGSLRDGLAALVADGQRATPRLLPVALRPRIAGRPSKAQQIWRFLEYAAIQKGVVFLTRSQIAEIWTGAEL